MHILSQPKKYLINAITWDGYDIDLEDASIERKINFFYRTFKSEYGWMLKRKSLARTLTEYFQGLPSCMDIAFSNNDILQVYSDWMTELNNEQDEDRAIEDWFKMLGSEMAILLRKYTNIE